jgi:hypothetical protein
MRRHSWAARRRAAAAPPRPTPAVRLPLRRARAARAGGSAARGRHRRDGGAPRRVFTVGPPRPPAPASRVRGGVVAAPAAREVELRGAGAPGRQARGPQRPQPGFQSVGGDQREVCER